MISEEKFVSEVLSSFNNIREEFKEIRENSNDRHEQIMNQIHDLCNKHSELKSSLETHLKVEEEIEKYKSEHTETNDKKSQKKFYLIFGFISAIVTVSNLLIVVSSKI